MVLFASTILALIFGLIPQGHGQAFHYRAPQAGFGPGYGDAFHRRFNIPPPQDYGGVRLPDLPPNGWVYAGDPNVGLATPTYTPVPIPEPSYGHRVLSTVGKPLNCEHGRQINSVEWECF